MIGDSDFECVSVGDDVLIRKGRSPDKIGRVCHVTPKQFKVECFGSFWKRNGHEVGGSTWYKGYATKPERGDRARIAAEKKRRTNQRILSGWSTYELNDDELDQVASIITGATKRRAEEAENGNE